MANRTRYYNSSYDWIRDQAIFFWGQYLINKDNDDELAKKTAAKAYDNFDCLVEAAMEVYGKTARIITLWQKEARKKIENN